MTPSRSPTTAAVVGVRSRPAESSFPIEPSLPLESAQSLTNLSTVRIVLFVMRLKCLDWTVELVSLLKPLNAFGSGYMREPGTTDSSVI